MVIGMKISVSSRLMVLSLAGLSPAFAQESRVQDVENDADTQYAMAELVGQQAQQWVAQSAGRGFKALEPGVYTVSLNDIPASTEAKDIIESNIRKYAQDGYISVPNERIPKPSTISSLLSRRESRPVEQFRDRLALPPSDLSNTVLAKAEYLDARPSGKIENGRASGLTRVYRIADAGLITFGEDDYRSAGTRITRVKEALNAEVNGVPAEATALKAADGRASVMLRWITPLRSYRLTLVTDNSDHLQKNKDLLMDIATRVIE